MNNNKVFMNNNKVFMNNNKNRLRAFFSLLMLMISFTSLNAFSQSPTNLSPNANGKSGQIPSGVSSIIFQLSNGNWVKNISLPTNPADQNRVEVRSSAGYTAEINTLRTDYPADSLTIRNGERYTFTYHVAQRQWRISGAGITQSGGSQTNGSGIIPNNPGAITFYSLSNDNRTSSVTLPSQANKNDTIIVRSSSDSSSRVSSDNLVYSNTLLVQKNDVYTFVYQDLPIGWLLIKSPVRTVQARNLDSGRLSQLTSPQTEVYFSDGNWVREMSLPGSAGNRDKVAIVADSTWDVVIDGSNIADYDSLRLKKGQRIELTFIQDQRLWNVTDLGEPTEIKAKDIVNNQLPTPLTSRTLVKFSDGNWIRNVQLPSKGVPGTRIIFDTKATWAFTVSGLNQSRTDSITIENGELVSVKVNSQGVWEKETVTIDILMVYSDKLAQRIGESAARARAFESFSLTNDGLENSGANFRIRLVGLRKLNTPDTWTTLDESVRKLRDNTTVQAWRNELNADFVYYEGIESGCGLAWVNASSYNAVGTGSINCGTTVMRHEFGHNMGLNHGVFSGTDGKYARGYSVVRSIMGGNGIPYFSTPKRYTAEGIPMGIVDQIDGVRAMNEKSFSKSNFR